MAAEDVTVSLATASTSIRVTKLSRPEVNRQLKANGASVTVAAAGNTVVNLGALDAILVERLVTPAPVQKELPVSTGEQFSG